VNIFQKLFQYYNATDHNNSVLYIMIPKKISNLFLKNLILTKQSKTKNEECQHFWKMSNFEKFQDFEEYQDFWKIWRLLTFLNIIEIFCRIFEIVEMLIFEKFQYFWRISRFWRLWRFLGFFVDFSRLLNEGEDSLWMLRFLKNL
jgi:hypothetical protein